MAANLFWIALGGALGSVARFLVGKGFQSLFPGMVFPWSTFIINITGCFLIGCFAAWSLKQSGANENLSLFFITGICGGFTTFSTFSFENFLLLKDGRFALFLMYASGSVFLGLAATMAAYKLFR